MERTSTLFIVFTNIIQYSNKSDNIWGATCKKTRKAPFGALLINYTL